MSECQNCIELNKRIEKLERIVEVLQAENKKLQARLLAYENAHTPPSLRKGWRRPPKKRGGRIGAPEGHEGTTRQEPEPDKVIDVKPLTYCPNCDSKLGQPDGMERRIVEDIPEPQPINVTQFNLPKQTCACCGLKLIASHPDCPTTGRFGFNTQAHVALQKYAERLPHRKIVEALQRDLGLNVSPATVLDINTRVARKLDPAYLQLINAIRKSQYVYVDETGLKVNGVTYWIWVFTTEDTSLIVVRPSRGQKVVREILGEYTGTVISDGYRVYSNYTSNRQRCWAHKLREAKDAAEKNPEGKPFYAKLCMLFRRLSKRYRTQMTGIQRKALWSHAIKRHHDLLALTDKLDSLKKMAEKIRNGGIHWFTFLLHPEIEPTNNRAERAIRETIVQRKIFGCLRNQKGTHNLEVLISLLATWKLRGQNQKTELLNALRS